MRTFCCHDDACAALESELSSGGGARTIIITGPRGCGKTHVCRTVLAGMAPGAGVMVVPWDPTATGMKLPSSSGLLCGQQKRDVKRLVYVVDDVDCAVMLSKGGGAAMVSVIKSIADSQRPPAHNVCMAVEDSPQHGSTGESGKWFTQRGSQEMPRQHEGGCGGWTPPGGPPQAHTRVFTDIRLVMTATRPAGAWDRAMATVVGAVDCTLELAINNAAMELVVERAASCIAAASSELAASCIAAAVRQGMACSGSVRVALATLQVSVDGGLGEGASNGCDTAAGDSGVDVDEEGVSAGAGVTAVRALNHASAAADVRRAWELSMVEARGADWDGAWSMPVKRLWQGLRKPL